jgi:hypothetical protein
MNTDVEELLRDGMERFTAHLQAPAGLAHAASRRRRRRLAVRTAVACGTAAVTAAAAVAVIGGAARPAGGGTQARTAAYVLTRVRNALAGQDLVYRGQTTASDGEHSTTWVYGNRSQWVEDSSGGAPYSDEGTAIIGGKHESVYVIYPDRKWMVLGQGWGKHTAACRPHSPVQLAGIPIVTGSWSDFINQLLGCGNATITGHAVIDGVQTTKITAKTVTEKLPPPYSKVIREKWSRAESTLYVNSKTYLPVRIAGSNETYGGAGGRTDYRLVTDVQWLPPTTANIARTLVTVPAGFRQVSSADGM